ncbi:MAG: thioredoxin family protein [Candidatus Electrothrix aestuarii]|uniref:Thioredoxin family protein n=1 Tax=Candidatus Electrothrix aestuarii TaxID=3062594 RepID=A0AAU8LTW4_9BACT|nr:thioredoxin family protein [Candidatus Electrothrix aestuarii]WPD21213.1 MAG: thioredoxin family protein [Candidatus Electrothrix sp. GW3-3]
MLYQSSTLYNERTINSLVPNFLWEILSPEWLTDYETALSFAQQMDKIILVHFTSSDVCQYCDYLKKEVYYTLQFVRWATKNAILLKIDLPAYKSLPEHIVAQNKGLKKKYSISCYPTVIGLYPDGTERGRLEGYYPGTGVADWLRGFNKITMLTP